MSKKVRRPPPKSPMSSLLGVISQPQSTPSASAKPKKKRLKVSVGDLVSYHPIHHHSQGSVGEVTAILDRDRVIVKSYSPQYEAYEGHEWVALTYRPTGRTVDGEPQADFTIYLTKLVYRAPQQQQPQIDPPKVKKPKPVTVLEGQDALLAHLADVDHNPKADVVYIPDSA